jgi:hypothetical protein
MGAKVLPNLLIQKKKIAQLIIETGQKPIRADYNELLPNQETPRSRANNLTNSQTQNGYNPYI